MLGLLKGFEQMRPMYALERTCISVSSSSMRVVSKVNGEERLVSGTEEGRVERGCECLQLGKSRTERIPVDVLMPATAPNVGVASSAALTRVENGSVCLIETICCCQRRKQEEVVSAMSRMIHGSEKGEGLT